MKVSAICDLRRVRLLYDRLGIEAQVRDLQALGMNSESYGKLLIPLHSNGKVTSEYTFVNFKGPRLTRMDLDVLLNTFKQEIEARERCTSSICMCAAG